MGAVVEYRIESSDEVHVRRSLAAKDREIGRRCATSISVSTVNWGAEVRALACVRHAMRQAEALS